MLDRTGLNRRLLKSWPRSTVLIAVCAIVSFCCGIAGWSQLADTLELTPADVVYRSIVALTLAIPYQSSANWQANGLIETARWSGLLAVVIGASKALVYLLRERWTARLAAHRRGHWLVVGDDPMAAWLSTAALQQGLRVHWLGCSRAQLDALSHDKLFGDVRSWHPSHARALGLDHAVGVMVAARNDATTHAIARSARLALGRDHPCTVVACIQSPWLGLCTESLERAIRVSVVSQAQLAARQVLQRHPPFLLAEHANHTRIHSVIVGFSSYGESVLIETLLCALTTSLQRPRFTIVDRSPEDVDHALALRYPELAHSADIRVVAGHGGPSGITLDHGALSDLIEQSPITAVYCCATDDGVPLASAMAFHAQIAKRPGPTPPVFCREKYANALPPATAGVRTLNTERPIPFGALDTLSQDTGLFSDGIDHLARVFHQRYRFAAQDDKPADVPWETLTEDQRDANRRLVLHLPATLHELGGDLESWLQGQDTGLDLAQLPALGATRLSDDRLEQLAALEHERWMAERRLHGWTHDPIRDDSRKLHPDLVPYGQLSGESRALDRALVRSQIQVLSTPRSDAQSCAKSN